MISSIFYNGDGSTRIFPVTFKINGEDYVRVYVDNVEVIDRTKYDIINNSIVFAPGDIPAVGTDNIKIYVATSSSELGDLGAPLTDITNVANNLAEIVAVSTQVIPNLPEILLADNNATIATTQANLAIAAMNAAEVSEANAAAGATTATSQALIATTKATSASNSATSASNSATTATTKANEASASASSALTSANNANTSETMAYKWSSNPVDTIVETDKYSALHWATKAQQWASTVDTTNFVDRTTNQTIGGTKTFSSSPIVPTPTTNFQSATKEYVDSKSTLSVGTILNGYTIFENCIVAFGGEFNRADYPKLWAYLQANPSLVKTQAQWQTEATANGGICGFYSSGDGTTTFRVPNLDKAFLRPDSRSIASYQEGSYVVGDSSGSTKSVESVINYDDNITAFRGRMNWDSLSTVSIGAANLLAASTSGSTSSYQTYPSDFGVTRPKNIAVLPLIVAK